MNAQRAQPSRGTHGQIIHQPRVPMNVEDELPRGSVPRTGLATGCCSSRTQENLASSGAAKTLNSAGTTSTASHLPFPKVTAKSQANCPLYPYQPKVRGGAGGCSRPQRFLDLNLGIHSKVSFVSHPTAEHRESGKTRTTGTGKCPQAWDQFSWQQDSLVVNQQLP